MFLLHVPERAQGRLYTPRPNRARAQLNDPPSCSNEASRLLRGSVVRHDVNHPGTKTGRVNRRLEARLSCTTSLRFLRNFLHLASNSRTTAAPTACHLIALMFVPAQATVGRRSPRPTALAATTGRLVRHTRQSLALVCTSTAMYRMRSRSVEMALQRRTRLRRRPAIAEALWVQALRTTVIAPTRWLARA